MTDWIYTEELRAQLHHPEGPRGRHGVGRAHDRDVARLLAPWRRHHGGPDAAARRD